MLIYQRARRDSFCNVVDSVYILSNRANPGSRVVWTNDRVDHVTGLVFQYGKLENLRLRLDPDNRLKIEGSLPKYLFGSNIETLSRTDLIKAIDQLSLEAGIDADAARVYRLDLAATLQMPAPVATYLPILGYLPRFTRTQHDSTGVTYASKQRSITFYDKGEEAGEGKNLLRIELKFKKRLKAQLGQAVFLSDLHSESLFKGLVDRWGNQYKAIQKNSRHHIKPPINMKDFREQLARIGIAALGGQLAALGKIEYWDIERHHKKRCRDLVNTLCATGNSLKDALLIDELDDAVQCTINEALQDITPH